MWNYEVEELIEHMKRIKQDLAGVCALLQLELKENRSIDDVYRAAWTYANSCHENIGEAIERMPR